MIRSFQGRTPQIAASVFVSEAAYIVGEVEIGEDSSVWPGAVIRGDMGYIKIGRNTQIEDNVVLHGAPGGLEIGDRVQIGHGAVVNGTRIGNNVLIGMNATILHGAVIGDFCVITASSLVAQGAEIPSKSLVSGLPGKVIGKPLAKHLWWVEEGPSAYIKLAQEYMREGL